mmetsp:Transcript_45940/g.137285  ORF Transcript_45940/g.137285 Transcript_45940/m.137285 type:complete len:259 (-) Transcript_45940:141-917(-)
MSCPSASSTRCSGASARPQSLGTCAAARSRSAARATVRRHPRSWTDSSSSTASRTRRPGTASGGTLESTMSPGRRARGCATGPHTSSAAMPPWCWQRCNFSNASLSRRRQHSALDVALPIDHNAACMLFAACFLSFILWPQCVLGLWQRCVRSLHWQQHSHGPGDVVCMRQAFVAWQHFSQGANSGPASHRHAHTHSHTAAPAAAAAPTAVAAPVSAGAHALVCGVHSCGCTRAHSPNGVPLNSQRTRPAMRSAGILS